jgi:hypothetical protein
VNLFEFNCKKRKKLKKIFLHMENGSQRRCGYTYRGGYTYRAGCILIFVKILSKMLFTAKNDIKT